MVIVVTSCDKNEDIFYAFYHCMEKYWKGHPEIIYVTETIQNPYYKTINKDYPVELWTKRMREALKEIEDKHVLLMADDLFIREKVDTKRLKEADKLVKDNVALVNLEKCFNENDKEVVPGFKMRTKGSAYELSLMCGIWDREKLIHVLDKDTDCWSIEYGQDTKGYDYLINGGNFIINFGYEYMKHCGLKKGKWCKEVIPFFEKEKIDIDYMKRGFYD